ncbi:DNRLRE domain-containing protein, partial [Aeromicrobium alkaliterrae]|uniref:DNRLRE domain-containing protein n=1 Tax=Aeromicrobium alkaliterrae TaxID=302168 RepID=UPI0031E377AD
MSGRLVARLVPALIVALVLSLLGFPAQAYDPADADEERRAELQDVEALDSTGNENTVPGNSSALGEALAAAKESGEQIEVESLRTEYETFYANPDGTFTRDTTQTPTRAENADGDLVPINTDLSEAGERLEPTATTDEVSLSATGDGSLASLTLDSGASIALGLPQLELAAPTVDGSVATYEVTSEPSAPATPEQEPSPAPSPSPEVSPEAPTDGATAVEPASFRINEVTPAADSVRVGVGSTGFAAHVLLEAAPAVAPEYVFDFSAPGLTAELVDGVLIFKDADGVVVAQSAPLMMWDAQVDENGLPANQAAVDAELTQDGETWRLTLKPAMDFLNAESTQYPVTIDPDISSVNRLGTGYVSEGNPNTSYTNATTLTVGAAGGRNEALMAFSYNEYLGATVTRAYLTLWQISAASCTAQPTNIYSVVSGDGPNWTWNTRPTYSTDPRFTATQVSFRGASSCNAGLESADVTNIVNGWAGRHVGPETQPFATRQVYNNRQVFALAAPNPTDPAQKRVFCSGVVSTTCPTIGLDKQPKLSVTFTPDTGAQSWYSMTDRPLGDRMSLSVNNRNGNVVVQNADIDVAGVGLDFTLQRTYNSQGVETGPLGPRWSLSIGPDVWLEKKTEYRYDFHGPGGTVIGSFVRKSSNPASPDYNKFSTPVGGAGADLTQSGAEFTLTFRQNQSKYVFGQPDIFGNTYMRYLRDRSNNQIEAQYSGLPSYPPKVSQFIDSAGRTYTPTYTGEVITKIATADVSGPGVREWNYAYTDGNLTSSSDAAGNATTYEYVAASGAPRLSKITQPVNQSGAAPTTEITYNTASAEVATIGARLDNSATGLLTYSWQFNTGLVPACQNNGQLSTVVTDARGKPTTYCYAKRNNSASDAKIWVYDALGKARSEDYSADNQPLSSTSAGNQSLTADGSTVNTYNNDITDQLTTVTQPKNGSTSGQAATGNANYGGTPSNVQGGTYLPSDVKDTAGDCNAYDYDTMGRTTVSYSGISSSGSTCGSKTAAGVNKTHSEYNPNGTTSKTWDANAVPPGGTPTDAEKTVYTYWQTTDPGFVAGTQWQVKSIKKPGGDCSNTASRRLCTSFTYDGAARVLTETDGRGEVTAYAYDQMDRTTRVFYNGATELNCLLITLTGDCIMYTYDAAG